MPLCERASAARFYVESFIHCSLAIVGSLWQCV
ncbi:Uncharacterised protein [Cedecea lapagei]|uniref:Uncharacterized protein n=1 Tax=Cedecea lapagei TaxID=158823 RepID=A0A447V088_9ENTR|nr:Uncharacterised protein [Cedecea lapagei]